MYWSRVPPKFVQSGRRDLFSSEGSAQNAFAASHCGPSPSSWALPF